MATVWVGMKTMTNDDDDLHCLYFDGEEINLAVRAYTHGYDFFYPNRHVLYHLYGHGSDKHWTDHGQNTMEVPLAWKNEDTPVRH